MGRNPLTATRRRGMVGAARQQRSVRHRVIAPTEPEIGQPIRGPVGGSGSRIGRCDWSVRRRRVATSGWCARRRRTSVGPEELTGFGREATRGHHRFRPRTRVNVRESADDRVGFGASQGDRPAVHGLRFPTPTIRGEPWPCPPLTRPTHRPFACWPSRSCVGLRRPQGRREGDRAEDVIPERRDRSRRGKPVRGGKLIYGLEADTAGGFCLSEGQLAISGMMIVRAIYDTLTVPNSKGGYSPYLAEKFTHDASYKTWTIKVRDGVTFHDGIEARRPRWSRTTSTPTAASTRAGCHCWPGSRWATSPSVTLKSPMVVEIKTKVPWAAFPAYLYGGSRFGMMAQAQLDDKETCDRKLIGTGPFVFKSWKPNEKLTGVRNEKYWQDAPDGKPYPYADSIEFRPIPEGAQRVNALESGTINVMHSSSPRDISGALNDLRDAGKANILVSQDRAEVGYLMLNSSVAAVRRRSDAPGPRHVDRPQRDQHRPGRRPPDRRRRPVLARNPRLCQEPGVPEVRRGRSQTPRGRLREGRQEGRAHTHPPRRPRDHPAR